MKEKKTDPLKDMEHLHQHLNTAMYLMSISIFLTVWGGRIVKLLSEVVAFFSIGLLFYCAIAFVWTLDYFYLKLFLTTAFGIGFMLVVGGFLIGEKKSSPNMVSMEEHKKWHYEEYKKKMDEYYMKEDKDISWEQRYKSLYRRAEEERQLLYEKIAQMYKDKAIQK